MIFQTTDFNGAQTLVQSMFRREWKSIERILKNMPLHLKASDQGGIQGTPIFNPVGTNEHIKAGLLKLPGWRANIPIPAEFNFLGTNLDFCHGAVLVEVQFSNYPFLLNNTLRAELFYKAKMPMAGKPMELAIIVTKAKMFPASNSTLYYEQAARQLTALASNHVFDVPVRLLGLFAPTSGVIPIRYTKYSASRYSRTVVKRVEMQCEVARGKTEKSRCTLRVID